MSDYNIEHDGLTMSITYKKIGLLPIKILVNPIGGDGFAEYVVKRKCKPIKKPNHWCFVDYYCACGHKLIEIANGLEHKPKYCEECGAEIIYE